MSQLQTPETGEQPPTQEQTQAALLAIHEDRREEAAGALRELCECIIKSVTAVDRSHNVGAYLTRIELIAKGEGNFELRLYEKDTGVDVDAIARQVADSISDNGGEYGKPLRAVQLNFGPGGPINGNGQTAGSH